MIWGSTTGDRQHHCGNEAHSYVTVATVSDQADRSKVCLYNTVLFLRHIQCSLMADSFSVCHVFTPVLQRLLMHTVQLPTPSWLLQPAVTSWEHTAPFHISIYTVQNESSSGMVLPPPPPPQPKTSCCWEIQLHGSSPFLIIPQVVPEALYFVVETEKSSNVTAELWLFLVWLNFIVVGLQNGGNKMEEMGVWERLEECFKNASLLKYLQKGQPKHTPSLLHKCWS